MTLTRKETIERLKQNKAAAEYYAGQSRITAEIENALKDSEAFDMAIEALQDRPTGEWILVKGSNGKDYHKCSKCLHTQEITGVKNYCAVCCARMKGGAI